MAKGDVLMEHGDVVNDLVESRYGPVVVLRVHYLHLHIIIHLLFMSLLTLGDEPSHIPICTDSQAK